MTVLFAPDKFKGTLTAAAAAAAMARGWRQARPHDRRVLLPVTDGGDGFGDTMQRLLGAEKRLLSTVDAAHRSCHAAWGFVRRDSLAIIESAAIIGLAMLPPGKFHPDELDTFGLGLLLTSLATKGIKECLIGIGGSATNDGGFGLARACGWKFTDAQGQVLKSWTELRRLKTIRRPQSLRLPRLIVAVDVQNPLLGPNGASRIYGPQKGLHGAALEHAEACLQQLALVSKRTFGQDYALRPGAGAAGGLGFGLQAFAGAELKSGFDLFSEHSDLEKLLRKASVVLTGEGRLDRSSLMGKATGAIAELCSKRSIPCFAIVGEAALPRRTRASFAGSYALSDFSSRDEAIRHTARSLARMVRAAAPHIVLHLRPRRANLAASCE